MVSDPFRTRPAGVSTIEEILLRVLPALAGATVSGAFVRLGSDSFPSFGGSVKTRPASAARPLLPYRTCQLLSASLFQGVAKRHERLLWNRVGEEHFDRDGLRRSLISRQSALSAFSLMVCYQ